MATAFRQVLQSSMSECHRDQPVPSVYAEQAVIDAQYAEVESCIKNVNLVLKSKLVHTECESQCQTAC